MAPKTNLKNCENGEHCDDHSGVVMWMKVNAAIGSFLSAVILASIGYSALFQMPNFKEAVAKELAQIKQDNATRDVKIQGSIDRVSRLEDVVFKK